MHSKYRQSNREIDDDDQKKENSTISHKFSFDYIIVLPISVSIPIYRCTLIIFAELNNKVDLEINTRNLILLSIIN
jgi:hypothetical protein